MEKLVLKLYLDDSALSDEMNVRMTALSNELGWCEVDLLDSHYEASCPCARLMWKDMRYTGLTFHGDVSTSPESLFRAALEMARENELEAIPVDGKHISIDADLRGKARNEDIERVRKALDERAFLDVFSLR